MFKHLKRLFQSSKPKNRTDYAFWVATRFGPSLGLRFDERIRRKIPDATNDELKTWEELFDRINKSVWKIAERGGAEKIGYEKAQEELRTSYPFLEGEGLDQAIFLSNYYAWHEGFSGGDDNRGPTV